MAFFSLKKIKMTFLNVNLGLTENHGNVTGFRVGIHKTS